MRRRAEAVSGLPFDSHQLLHNGKVLSGRPLAEYGVHKGSVLELVPYEPFIPQPMPEGSPLLSSPDHELVGVLSLLDQLHALLFQDAVCHIPFQWLAVELCGVG